MLSGIGPASQLQAHGIPVVSDLHGVGNNMIDQTFIFTIHQLNITTNSGVLTNPALHAAAVDTYLNEQNGPLTGVGGDIIGQPLPRPLGQLLNYFQAGRRSPIAKRSPPPPLKSLIASHPTGPRQSILASAPEPIPMTSRWQTTTSS